MDWYQHAVDNEIATVDTVHFDRAGYAEMVALVKDGISAA